MAIVRLKKQKKRFEIACYKNKVLEYRSGMCVHPHYPPPPLPTSRLALALAHTCCHIYSETDLDEVLQTDQVFTNVSKGALAPKAELTKAFGNKPQSEIILEILQKGELQVGEKERSAKLDQIHAEVISIIAEKCVDPATKRVYTPTMIEKALTELSSRKDSAADDNAGSGGGGGGGGEGAGTKAEDGENTGAGNGVGADDDKPVWRGVTEKRSAKAQALEAIKALVAHQVIPIARARMRLRIVATKKCKEKVLESVEQVEEEEFGNTGNWECVAFVEPGKYKRLVDIVGAETKGRGRVEVLDTAVSLSLSLSLRMDGGYGNSSHD